MRPLSAQNGVPLKASPYLVGSVTTPGDVLKNVWSLAADVLGQETLRLRVVVLDPSVTSAHSIATEHYQIAPDVVSRVFHDVVQREPEPDPILEAHRSAERTLSPFEMEPPEKLRISNARFLLEVSNHSLPIHHVGHVSHPRLILRLGRASNTRMLPKRR